MWVTQSSKIAIVKSRRIWKEEYEFPRHSPVQTMQKKINDGCSRTHICIARNTARKWVPIVPARGFPDRKTQTGKHTFTLLDHGLLSSEAGGRHRTNPWILPAQQFPPHSLSRLSKGTHPHQMTSSANSKSGRNPILTLNITSTAYIKFLSFTLIQYTCRLHDSI